MEQLYIGEVVACYVNLSKKNKEYATGYIRLPDANGNIESYKFVVFKEEPVSKLKGLGPTNLKGQSIGFIGEFRENTYNGVSEYQLIVSQLAEDSLMAPDEVPANQPQPQIQTQENGIEIPQVPNV